MQSKRWRVQGWKSALAATLMAGLCMFGGAAYAIDVGARAPDFALMSNTGKEIKLADFAGKKAVVLFFYVGAFTST